ncbi:hypothetical protein PIB30_026788 [Stylosanthes scabra]|uniref:TF-B3 domain-containing protein n=1 Tax=Stylosanthes scabra TaxID=79078 RepID=A0ABU6YB08_9FABA|nr:hypothetical protein [Stylosanthes scabra]
MTPTTQLGGSASFAPKTFLNSRAVTPRGAAIISAMNGQSDGVAVPNAGLSFTGFRNNSSMHLASLARFYPKTEMNNSMDDVIHSTHFVIGGNSAEISCTKRLTTNQIYSSCVIIPLRFAREAFSSRNNGVLVSFGNKPPTRMGLRWNTTHKTTVYLTRGWKYFAKINGFQHGTEMKFSVTPPNESIMTINLFGP